MSKAALVIEAKLTSAAGAAVKHVPPHLEPGMSPASATDDRQIVSNKVVMSFFMGASKYLKF